MKKQWKPKMGEKYWYIGCYVQPKQTWVSGTRENHKEMRGNIFRTKALALKAARKIRKVLREVEHG